MPLSQGDYRLPSNFFSC